MDVGSERGSGRLWEMACAGMGCGMVVVLEGGLVVVWEGRVGCSVRGVDWL